ncbi:MAG: GlsB/YeaQ/YmgE family stress response membrane protein [Xanthomonadales bacterium]|nr:GlsB/YeaQ/YmgE family stress response membrane protein [Xanthomonadales bacterium]
MFEIESLFIWLIVGAVAGWLAGMIMKSKGGLVNNIIVGIIGAFIGGWLLTTLGVTVGNGMISAIITATIGAVVLLFAIGLIKK